MRRKVLAVIPARLNSSRFPGKVIYPYRGKPLLAHLVEALQNSRLIDRLVVATDNRDIVKALAGCGVEVMRTSSRHRTGSDRAAEVLEKVGGDVVVNIQADNMGLTAAALDRALGRFLKESDIPTGTMARRIDDDRDLFDPNVVKVIIDGHARALWFSRYPLPFVRGAQAGERWRQHRFWYHVGVYFFCAEALRRFAGCPRTALERAESLEQLRVLENGMPMRVYATRGRTVSVDTPADLRKLRGLYR